MNEEFSRLEWKPTTISTLLTKAVLNPQEWRERLTTAVTPSQAWPKHALVHQDKHYTIILSYWGTGPERSVAVEGGSGMSWTLVLEGELEEQAIAVGSEGPSVVRSSVLKEDRRPSETGRQSRVWL